MQSEPGGAEDVTFPLAELAAQLAPPGPTFGRVVALNGTRVVAATPKRRRLAVAAVAVSGRSGGDSGGLAYLSPVVNNAIPV